VAPGGPAAPAVVEAARPEPRFPLTCSDWLTVLQPHLTAPLFSAPAVDRLRYAGRRLPGDGLSVLEVRLAPEADPVDLSVRIREPATARRIDPPLPARLLDLWDTGKPLSPLRALWLELDLDRPVKDLSPILCAELPRDVEPGLVTDSLLPALQGKPLGMEQRRLIRCCLQEIPAPGHLLYVFGLAPRGTDAARLEIAGLTLPAILEYLGRVAPRTVQPAGAIAPALAETERLHLSLDLGADVADILPRVGIEGSFPRQPPRETRWEALFNRLVKLGLCSPARRAAALAWPGYDTFWTAPTTWPLAAAGGRGYCVRRLSHVKVACEPDRPPEAKAYLAFEPLDRSAAAAIA
jgi:hypothetical protein